jgi:hypothetical protein
MGRLPTLFVGSSTETLDVAKSVQVALEDTAEVTVWSQGVFQPGTPYIQALAEAADKFDFALLIMGADDVLESRGTAISAPRDNVIFELGLFIGALGRNRTFFMYNRDYELKVPTDLSGVAALTYRSRSDGNLHAAIAPACERLTEVLQRMGPRESARLEVTFKFSGRPEDLTDEQRRQLKAVLGMEIREAARERPSAELAAGPKTDRLKPHFEQFDIFLSHAGPDRQAATELYDELAAHCKVFLDSKSLRLGDSWDEAIAAAQQASKVTLVLISNQVDNAYYQREEVARAIDLARTRTSGHRVIPVLLDDSAMEQAPYGLRLRHGISWQQANGAKGVARAVLDALRELQE